jgi:HK97 family phage portal protein
MIVSNGVATKSPNTVWTGSPATWGTWPTSLNIGNLWASYSALYRKQHWVRTCVDKRAVLLARLPLKVYQHDDLNRPEEPAHPYAQLLARPNDRQSRYSFWREMLSTFDIYGEAFALKIRDSGGRPVQLAPLHPTAMQCEEKAGRVLWEFENPRVHITDIPAEDLIHLRTYNPDSSTRGLSKLESLRSTLENEDAALRSQSSFWRRGARPGVALTHPGKLSQPAADRLKLRWDQVAAGADNTGTTVVLEEGMKPELMQISAVEAQYIEARKLNREEVVAGFDMPPPAVHILDHATYCLPGDSLIETDHGPVPIADVHEGDYVWAHDEASHQLRLSRVTQVAQSGVEPVYTVRTANRTVRMTGNHRLLTRWAKETTGSDHPNRQRYDVDLAYRRADSLLLGDLLVTLRELPDHGGDVCPTRHVSEGFAEFCGLLLGDGSVDLKNGCVSIARAGHGNYMDHYRAVMRDEFRRRGDRPITLGEQERSTRFVSIAAARELRDLGLTGTAHTKTVPAWVHRLSSKLRAAFVRGFLDADGSVDKKGRMSFSSCNRVLLEQIRHLCIGLGVPVTNLSHHQGDALLPNGTSVPTSQWAFTCSDPGANRAIGSNDLRYVTRLTDGRPFWKSYYSYPDAPGRDLPAPAGCQYSKVVSIDQSPIAVPVYDITVEDDHCFIADGVVVHNSNITEQMRSVYRDTMAPVTVFLESELEAQLRGSVRRGASEPDFGDDVYAEFLLDGVLRGDFEQRAAAYQQAINSGWTTPAEVRKLENLPFIEGSDRLYINSTMVPLEVQAEEIEDQEERFDPALVEAVGSLIRAGFDPTSILAALGLPTIRHLGLLPITLQKEEQFDADLEIAEAELVDDADVRMLMGRLSRQKTLDDVDPDALVEGLNGLGPVVLRALEAAKADGKDLAEFRADLKTELLVTPPRDELVEVLKALVAKDPVVNVSVLKPATITKTIVRDSNGNIAQIVEEG